jgi:hypothetical protein
MSELSSPLITLAVPDQAHAFPIVTFLVVPKQHAFTSLTSIYIAAGHVYHAHKYAARDMTTTLSCSIAMHRYIIETVVL